MTWIFSGRVHPERASLSINAPIEVHICGDIKFRARTNIICNQISTIIDEIIGEVDIFTLRNIIQSHVSLIVDLAGYRLGHAYDVEVISATNSNTGQVQVFGIDIPVIKEARPNSGEFTLGALSQAGADWAVPPILADFREAQRDPAATAFHCYRAVETIMQTFRDAPDGPKAQAWSRMKEALQIDGAVTDELKRRADGPRHGQHGPITGEERGLILTVSDKIIGRYLDFMERSRGAPPSELPVLHWPN